MDFPIVVWYFLVGSLSIFLKLSIFYESLNFFFKLCVVNFCEILKN